MFISVDSQNIFSDLTMYSGNIHDLYHIIVTVTHVVLIIKQYEHFQDEKTWTNEMLGSSKEPNVLDYKKI